MLDSSKYLGEEKITKLMLKFSIPCILSQLISALYNIVDQMFIGNSELSTLGNAATGVVFPFFIIAQAFAWWFGDGCAAYLSMCQGSGNTEKADKCIGGGVTLTFLSSVFLVAVFFAFKKPMLLLFGASENTIEYAIEYFNIVVAFFPVYMLANMMNSVTRADGAPNVAMLAMLLGAITNLALDPLFIFTFKMGMSGAAWATVIGQSVTFLVTFIYFFKTRTFKLKLSSFTLRSSALLSTVKIGLSTFVTQLTIVVVTLLCNVLLSKYGSMSKYGADIPIAVVGIQSKIFTLIINVVVGIALGSQPILSYNMGAKKYGRVKEVYLKTCASAIIIGLVSTLIIQLFPRAIIGIFGMPTNIPNPNDYWEFGELVFRIFMSLVTFTCIVKVNSIFFQAAGKPVYAVLTSLIRDIILFLPIVLILTSVTGIYGIIISAPISDLLSFILALYLSIKFIKSLKE